MLEMCTLATQCGYPDSHLFDAGSDLMSLFHGGSSVSQSGQRSQKTVSPGSYLHPTHPLFPQGQAGHGRWHHPPAGTPSWDFSDLHILALLPHPWGTGEPSVHAMLSNKPVSPLALHTSYQATTPTPLQAP